MIKELRLQRGYTQAQLADKVGINISQVQKLEAGTQKIENTTLKNALAIANALGVTVEELTKQEE